MRNLTLGMRIIATYVFPTAETSIIGRLEHIPSDTGDMCYITTDDGKIIAINLMCVFLQKIEEVTPHPARGEEDKA